MIEQMREYLPWSLDEFEVLIRSLVGQGFEGSKVDFKLEMPVSDSNHKADFLKDVLAFVNTSDVHYFDYGFLIFGAENKEIKGVSKNHPTGETYQTHLENLIRGYLSPFVPINVVMFNHTDKERPNWGVVVIPPSNNVPHMVFKEYKVKGGQGDPNKSLFRGQWFVRRGSTTDLALPEDYARVINEIVQKSVNPLQDQLKGLQALYNTIDEKLNRVNAISLGLNASSSDTIENTNQDDLDLPSRFALRLKGPDNFLLEDLQNEVYGLRLWLETKSSDLPWSFSQMQEQEINHRDVIELIEERTKVILKSVAYIIIYDDKGQFDQAVLNVLSVFANEISIPINMNYARELAGLRYYPLLLLTYMISILGVRFERNDLLRAAFRVSFLFGIPHKKYPLIQGLRLVHDSEGLFISGFGQNRHEVVKVRTKHFFDQFFGEVLPYENSDKIFFQGEFVLSLTSKMASTEEPKWIWPSLYFHDSKAIDYIQEFLRDPPIWFNNFYGEPTEEVLRFFDDHAQGSLRHTPLLPLGLWGNTLAVFKGQ